MATAVALIIVGKVTAEPSKLAARPNRQG